MIVIKGRKMCYETKKPVFKKKKKRERERERNRKTLFFTLSLFFFFSLFNVMQVIVCV